MDFCFPQVCIYKKLFLFPFSWNNTKSNFTKSSEWTYQKTAVVCKTVSYIEFVLTHFQFFFSKILI